MHLKVPRLFLIACLISSAVPAQAGILDAIADFQKPNMHIGQAKFHPYLKQTEIYDSNIFLQPRSKVAGQNANNNAAGPVLGSLISETNIGMKMNLPIGEIYKFDLGYDFVWRAFKKDPRVNNTVNQAVDAAFAYAGPSGISAKIRDSYLNTVDPATTEQTARNKRWQNTAGIEGEYAPKGGNLSFGLDGQLVTHKYIANDSGIRALLNRYEQTVGTKVGWQLQPQTRLYVGYHRQIIHYTVHQPAPTKNSKSHLVDVGIEGDIASKLKGRIQTGVIYRQYDDLQTNSSSKIHRNMTVSSQLEYKPLERTTVSLLAARSLQEATFSTNQYYIATSGSLSVSHKLPAKVTLGVNGSMEIDKYPNASTLGGFTSNRRDDLYQVGGSIGWDMKEWLSLTATHLYRTRYSRFSDQFNYKDHQTGFSVALLF